ncbi:MAG TPA: PEP-CTERM sorting domain-containing protein [Bryobacteraceae bacterium]|jgi:hypothetical protein|nr:PEP-CTERM sorting domain-containing protein [Bryobacteraceae bacterium]
MRIQVLVLGLVSALCASAANYQFCMINGAPAGCTAEDSASTGTAPDSSPAYSLSLSDASSDFADIYLTGINATLATTSATFSAYVPGAALNGDNASLSPYAYFTINPYGTTLGAGDPYALVIASTSGFTSSNDGWYTDGINANSTVHIVLVNWTAADAGITNPDWLTCCSDLPTLGQLLSVSIPATGSEAALTWGDTNVYKARVAAGDWGNSGTYQAYVGNFDVETSPEPGTLVLLGSAVLVLAGVRRRFGSIKS